MPQPEARGRTMSRLERWLDPRLVQAARAATSATSATPAANALESGPECVASRLRQPATGDRPGGAELAVSQAVATGLRHAEPQKPSVCAPVSQMSQISQPVRLQDRVASLVDRLAAGGAFEPAEAIAVLRTGARFQQAARVWRFDPRLPPAEMERRILDGLLAEWKNAQPAAGPQEGRCAGCGEPIDVAGCDWRIFGDGAWTHYGGSHGLRCWRAWTRRRDRQALIALLREMFPAAVR